ncbi:hypothetical protein KFK09_005597 [Dendrobium nobile]|uniref:Uncharacterized protein n=1 Tax=Dendrobium nobile TaxID=94219 RepID=A0A8T3C0Z3_DENNO|nr:hypothetical protein KFK09_005597 [Dendrobium nobile]
MQLWKKRKSIRNCAKGFTEQLNGDREYISDFSGDSASTADEGLTTGIAHEGLTTADSTVTGDSASTTISAAL